VIHGGYDETETVCLCGRTFPTREEARKHYKETGKEELPWVRVLKDADLTSELGLATDDHEREALVSPVFGVHADTLAVCRCDEACDDYIEVVIVPIL
jgi:hypothetical protein